MVNIFKKNSKWSRQRDTNIGSTFSLKIHSSALSKLPWNFIVPPSPGATQIDLPIAIKKIYKSQSKLIQKCDPNPKRKSHLVISSGVMICLVTNLHEDGFWEARICPIIFDAWNFDQVNKTIFF